MKKHQLSSEKMFSKKVVKANSPSFESIRAYQKAAEIIEKVRFPLGRQVVYKQVGVSTTASPMNIYGNITTG